MTDGIQAKILGLVSPARQAARREQYQKIHEANRHRVYSFAFWMTDNELSAEELSARTFHRAFAHSDAPSEETIDRMLLTEIREMMPVGSLTLNCPAAEKVEGIRHNVKRVHLERAVVQLPATERLIFVMHDGEGYSHERIARTLGISERESQGGLHQARLRIRELTLQMK
ncbi:MAG TPA: sigma factor-like helix-turn-helix DNA-binding protein [Terriglobales bacterium]|nr:sigma factor-like helix-turn-helix DNA-binding protein [Terriglobales bacterium]